jgi:hypothetical protein
MRSEGVARSPSLRIGLTGRLKNLPYNHGRPISSQLLRVVVGRHTNILRRRTV